MFLWNESLNVGYFSNSLVGTIVISMNSGKGLFFSPILSDALHIKLSIDVNLKIPRSNQVHSY